MPLDTQIELIKFFTLFVWIINAFIAGLLCISVGVIAWLCFAENRQSKFITKHSSIQRNAPDNTA